MKVNLTKTARPFGEIVALANTLNKRINNLGESQTGRNAAINAIHALEDETGLSLRT